MKAAAAVAAAALITGAWATASPAGAAERMRLNCASGTLAGHTIERTNGSSWWDVNSGTVFTTKSMSVREGNESVYEKDYGVKSGEVESCVADHFDFTWEVELVEAGK